MNTEEQPTRETHPKVRFWTKKDFDTWVHSPEAQNSNRGLYTYMEEEDGTVPDSEKLGNMCTALRAAWTDLTQRDLAPGTWGKASTRAWSFVHSTMEEAYPIFKFAEGGWKLETLCTNMYSSWRLKRLDNDGKLKKNGCSVKEEAFDDEDFEGHKPTARKHKGQGPTSRPSTKKPKGESLYTTHKSTDCLTPAAVEDSPIAKAITLTCGQLPSPSLSNSRLSGTPGSCLFLSLIPAQSHLLTT